MGGARSDEGGGTSDTTSESTSETSSETPSETPSETSSETSSGGPAVAPTLADLGATVGFGEPTGDGVGFAADRRAPSWTWVGERYRLGAMLGAGGSGGVFTAVDRLTGEAVAVKLVGTKTGAELASVRREVTALRRARIPGVVNLRDDGLHDDVYYVVTDRVDGAAPFPGVPAPAPWAAIAPRVVALLAILMRVHARGLVHRDLKPGNVLVDAAGKVWVVDFGIAAGPGVGGGPDTEVRLTPRYAAPERLDGQAGDRATDLYGVGAMVVEAVSGRRPRDVDPDAASALLIAAGAPPAAAEVLGRLLAEEPADRPTVRQVLAVLAPREADPVRQLLLPDAGVDEEALRGLFHGPDAFLHLREDGAKALFARTGGAPDAVRAVLGGWLADGACDVQDGRVVIERTTLDALLGGGIGEVTLDGVDRLLARGEIGRATAWIELGLAEARVERDRAAEAAYLVRLARASVAPAPPYALDTALYEIGRSGLVDSPEVAAAEALVRCQLAVRTKVLALARPLLASAAGATHPELERWTWNLRLHVAQLEGPAALVTALGELEAWAGDVPRRRMLYLHELGIHRYDQRDYRTAAALHEAAAELAERDEERIRALVRAAAAQLEVPDLAAVDRLAHATVTLAARVRHPGWELRGCWLARASRYRAGAPFPASPELVAAAQRVGGESAALLALNEAGAAWRAGDAALGAELADIAVDCARAVSRDGVRVLAQSLAAACRAPVPAEQVADLAAEAARLPLPDVASQALALLAVASGDEPLRLRARAIARSVPRVEGHNRLDILALDEV